MAHAMIPELPAGPVSTGILTDDIEPPKREGRVIIGHHQCAGNLSAFLCQKPTGWVYRILALSVMDARIPSLPACPFNEHRNVIICGIADLHIRSVSSGHFILSGLYSEPSLPYTGISCIICR